MDAKNLSRIEVGRGFPSLSTLERIGTALRVDMKDFFDYHHLEPVDEVATSIDLIAKSATEEELRLIYKLAKAVIS